MEEFSSCKSSMEECMKNGTFSVAHLYKEEKAMNMHIHDCYEMYYSISGGKQFLIDNRVYSIHPGDIFFINHYESHYLTQIDNSVHERIVLFIHPEYLKKLSTRETDLGTLFTNREAGFSHKLALNKEQQKRFLYFINKITTAEDFAHDIIEQAAFMECMAMLSGIGCSDEEATDNSNYKYNHQVDEILNYINANISTQISIEQLADHFFLSESYICRIFKSVTGTTINKYITARRITIAKALLSDGASVQAACDQSGFTDYSNFFKAFTKAVGVSPKKFAQYSVS